MKPAARWIGYLVLLTLAACSFSRPQVTSSPPSPSITAGGPTSAPPTRPMATPDAPQPATEEPTDRPTLEAGSLNIVYTKDGEIWRWQNGESVRLAGGPAYRPRISADGQIVAFLRQVDNFHQELWAVNLDGSSERKLVGVVDLDRIGGGVRDPNALAVNPFPEYEWLAGSHRLAFCSYQVFNGPGGGLLNDLHIVDADSGQISDVFLAGWGGAFAFSPDASQVAVVQTDKIILANADGSNYRPVLNFPPVVTYTEAPFYPAPQWAPDGSFLRVSIPPQDGLAAPDQPTSLYRIPADADQALLEGSVNTVFIVDAPVIYSPDLARVAFIREIQSETEVRRELHLATFDGAGDWAYAAGPMLVFGGWSPDSRRFIYTAGDEQEAFLGSLDAAPRPLDPQLSGAIGLHWIDARRVIYTVLRNSLFEVNLFNVDTGASRQIDTLSGDRPIYDWVAP